jgi:hypothetical protein
MLELPYENEVKNILRLSRVGRRLYIYITGPGNRHLCGGLSAAPHNEPMRVFPAAHPGAVEGYLECSSTRTSSAFLLNRVGDFSTFTSWF